MLNAITIPDPFSSPKRGLFTNCGSVFFAKKKADEAKIPSCPDFEQYFTKTKKGEGNKNGEEQMGKRNEDKQRPAIQPSIFGDKPKATPQLKIIAEKKSSTLKKANGGSNFPMKVPNIKKPQAPPDKTKSSEKQQTFDKKFPFTKPLSEFTQNILTSRTGRTSSDTKNVFNESRSPKQDPSSFPSRNTVDDNRTNGKISEVKVSTTVDSKNNKMNIWIAVGATAVCALGLVS